MKFTSEKVNELNQTRLKPLMPEFAAKVSRLIAFAEADGFILLVAQGLRTFAEQDALFAQGRSKKGKIVTKARGGQSWHNFGAAVDFVFITDGEPDWMDYLYGRIGTYAAKAGLEWGGNWKTIKDYPHVQMTNNLEVKDALAIYKKNGLSAVWHTIVLKMPTPTPPPADARFYTVVSGDSVSAILKRFGLKMAEFYQLNNLTSDNFDPGNIKIGQRFQIRFR